LPRSMPIERIFMLMILRMRDISVVARRTISLSGFT